MALSVDEAPTVIHRHPSLTHRGNHNRINNIHPGLQLHHPQFLRHPPAWRPWCPQSPVHRL
eukprot:12550094-Ditylum_brightwellii.AAC.1